MFADTKNVELVCKKTSFPGLIFLLVDLLPDYAVFCKCDKEILLPVLKKK